VVLFKNVFDEFRILGEDHPLCSGKDTVTFSESLDAFNDAFKRVVDQLNGTLVGSEERIAGGKVEFQGYLKIEC